MVRLSPINPAHLKNSVYLLMKQPSATLYFQCLLEIELVEKGVPRETIDLIISSGYGGRQYVDPFNYKNSNIPMSVSDTMYGSKTPSSKFAIEEFVAYAQGTHKFERFPGYPTFHIQNIEDLQKILADPRRRDYLEAGLLSFRGQTSEYKFKRNLPNPYRSDADGYELSILPGLYRQASSIYSFEYPPEESRDLTMALGVEDVFSHDPMRLRQHYGCQTPGLDVTFDIDVALFFATNKFSTDSNGLAYFEKIRDSHKGVIYGFVFRDPQVKRSEFEVLDHSLGEDLRPERIFRQCCGLPLISDVERNIAITDIDFVAYLDPNFRGAASYSAEYLFPSPREDAFYKYALDMKRRMDKVSHASSMFSELIEYSHA